MAFQIRSSTISITVLLTVTAFSCSMPIFSRSGVSTGGVVDKSFNPKPAKLSGILDLQDGCGPGFYQIRLQGLFEGATTQVDSQSDESGRFSLVAPPGQYSIQISNKDGCGAKQPVELEENTEHMISITVSETKAIEKVGQNDGRLPASVLILPKR